MAGRMHGGLIAACGNADAVEHEHQHEQRDAVPETVGGHGVECVGHAQDATLCRRGQ